MRRLVTRAVIERPLGVETARSVGLEELGLAGGESIQYEPSGWLALRRAVGRHQVGPDDVFVDIGSGKGRVLLEAARLPFKRVIGVEISAALNEVARLNLERSKPRLRCKQVEVVTADAGSFELPDEVTVAYLYNPVSGALFAAVVRRLLESYDRRPRRMRVIYRTPFHEAQLARTGRFRLVKTVRGFPPWSRQSSTRVYEVLPAKTSQAIVPEPAEIDLESATSSSRG